MLHTVIMAGGSGTRFWPASRARRPKQFLTLLGGRSLIQRSWDRCRLLTPPERCWVVTGEAHVELVREHLPELPAKNLLVEPAPRNTAPAIGLAALHIRESDPDATIAVFPSDHLIDPFDRFVLAIRAAEAALVREPDSLILFGIRPTFPSTGFGYIEAGESAPSSTGATPAAPAMVARPVASFREKPDRPTAETFLASGRFLWNSGIFVWRAARLMDLLAAHEPEMAAGLERIRGAGDRAAAIRTEFPSLRSISIDYAVLEREAPSARVIAAEFEWDDVGSWEALARRIAADPEGNRTAGPHIGIETSNCLVQTEGEHLVATIGVENLLIVHSPDATLVARRDDEAGMKRLIEQLRARGLDRYL